MIATEFICVHHFVHAAAYAALVFSADYLAVCQASWDLYLEGKKIQLLKKWKHFICCNLVLIHSATSFCFHCSFLLNCKSQTPFWLFHLIPLIDEKHDVTNEFDHFISVLYIFINIQKVC